MDILLLVVIAFILIIVGLIGVALPILPGVPLAWLGVLIFAWSTGFQKISIFTVLIFLLLTVIAQLLDFFVPLIGGKKYKASRWGIFGAISGMIIGFFTFNPLWLIILTIFGAFLGEILSGKEISGASRSALGFFLGFITSALIRIVIILIMLGFTIAALFK